MKHTKIYTPECGEDITTCIENTLRLGAKHQSESQFTFNGLTIKVCYWCDTINDLLEEWEIMCKESREAYKKSLEYKILQENQRLLLVENQTQLTELENNLSVTMGSEELLKWLIEFILCADHVGTTFDKGYILNLLLEMGYEDNMWVGFDGTWDKLNKLEYIVGQVINCLNTFGTPHPSIITFCEELLGEYS